MPDLLSVIEVIRAANGGCILPLNRAENTPRLVLLSRISLLISKLNIVNFVIISLFRVRTHLLETLRW